MEENMLEDYVQQQRDGDGVTVVSHFNTSVTLETDNQAICEALMVTMETKVSLKIIHDQ